jgi:ATP-dependent DNA helicase RecG
VAEAERLATTEFADFRVGLLHGQMGGAEKDATMGRFRDGEFQLLVTTTVIEVGVDVPNAAVMVVENAERFGLAQLHQLRGRVGRGGAQGYCILIADPASREAERRLQAMVEINDGFRLAEEDLALRGPGEFFGTRQSGLPELRLPIGEILGDVELLAKARQMAREALESDPSLASHQHQELRRIVTGRLGAVLSCVL